MPTFTQAGSIKILWTNSTINFATTAANIGTDSSAIAIAGASLGDPVIVSEDSGSPTANICYTGYVSTAGNVVVRLNNYSTASVDPDAAVFHIGVIKLVSYS
jgi:hypothetical protein